MCLCVVVVPVHRCVVVFSADTTVCTFVGTRDDLSHFHCMHCIFLELSKTPAHKVMCIRTLHTCYGRAVKACQCGSL